ncbi:MAG: S-adenosylmethionine:tRNA ribosyltransferase-isomerase [Candidatus Shikimatogenerans sp. JK-2022]|nr:S-adenosylmethionine:tRNA ribosyltransferase-isomerase [Candidatus Shikimatogenerans bostrichidophilus]
MLNKIKNIKIPKNLITKYPRLNKDIKLMIFNKKNKEIYHDKLNNLYKYFNKNDIIIKNNSKAYPIKYYCYKKDDYKQLIEIYLLKELSKKDNVWDILVNPARKIRIGNKIYFINTKNNKYILSEIIDNTTSKGRLLKFYYKDNAKLKKKLFKIGRFLIHNKTINKKNISIKYYQNSYAKKIGSVMLPTSGVYINKYILLNLKYHDINILDITLHLNFNKYYKLNYKNIYKHKDLNSELLFINKKVIKKINRILKNNNNINICTIGINTLRAIENIIFYKNKLIPYKSYINKMFPYKYKYKLITSLITYFNDFNTLNFLTLLNMCGLSNTYRIYKEAIKNNYNFFTYGDLLLII